VLRSPAMIELPPDVQAQRDFEDHAIELGLELSDAEARVVEIRGEVVELMDDAPGHGITIDRLANRIGRDRKTVYRWRDAIAIKRAKEKDGER
jgi:hypothetical protein